MWDTLYIQKNQTCVFRQYMPICLGIPENDPHWKTIPILKSENDPHINFRQIQKQKMIPIYILRKKLKENDLQIGNRKLCYYKNAAMQK